MSKCSSIEIHPTLSLETKGDCITQTIVATLEATMLEGIWTRHFANFLRLPKIYEQKLEEKMKEPNVSVSMTYYKASIERKYLMMMMKVRWVQAIDIAEISEEDIVAVVKSRT